VIEAQYRDISGETELEQQKKFVNDRRIKCIRGVELIRELLEELSAEMAQMPLEESYHPGVMYARGVIAGDFLREVAAMCEMTLNEIHQQTAPSIVVPDNTLVDRKGNPIGQGQD